MSLFFQQPNLSGHPDFNLMCGPSADRDFVCRWLNADPTAPKVPDLAPLSHS